MGITLAILFDNWNQNRIENDIEYKTLLELKQGIQNDLIDITANVDSYTLRSDAYDMLINHLENDQPFSDSLKQAAVWLKGATAFINNTAAYETLKARGFDIIDDDDIRIAVLNYYDVSQDWVLYNEEQNNDHYLKSIKPILIDYFNNGAHLDEANFEKLKQDRRAIQEFKWALGNQYYLLERYKELEREAERLVSLLPDK